MRVVHRADSIDVLRSIPDDHVDLIYVDVPYGTQKRQTSARISTQQSITGSLGFGGRQYHRSLVSSSSYSDQHVDYMNDFLIPRLAESKRVLKQTGTLYLHMNWRWSHYAKVYLDSLFGSENFLNHIVWSYNYGTRGDRRRFPRKHDDILVYTKSASWTFNWDDVDRIPYKAPSLQKSKERAELGQVPTDVWEMTIVPTNSKERIGYPNQKPLKLVERIVRASSNRGELVLDFCAGSGTTGIAAAKHDRSFILVDSSEVAIETMKKRFNQYGIEDIDYRT